MPSFIKLYDSADETTDDETRILSHHAVFTMIDVTKRFKEFGGDG